MPYGYSHRFVREVQQRYKSERSNVVVELCYLCVTNEIMLSEAADALEVSKQTIYNWFRGEYGPKPETQKKIERYNSKLRTKASKRT